MEDPSALPVLLQRVGWRSSLISGYFHISLNRTPSAFHPKQLKLFRLLLESSPIQTVGVFKGFVAAAGILVGLLPKSKARPRTTESYRICRRFFQRFFNAHSPPSICPACRQSTTLGLSRRSSCITPCSTLQRAGLQLLCYIHVGMALFDPKVDCGSGLQREYDIAKGMTGK